MQTTAWIISALLAHVSECEAAAEGVLPLSRSRRWPAHARAHALQSAGELRILLLHLELRACRLGIRQSVDDLAFRPRELGGTLEVLQRFGDLALLKKQLRHGSDGDVTFRVDYEMKSV